MTRVPVPPWRGLLQRKTQEHIRLFHTGATNLTRRGFLGTAALAAGVVSAPELALSPFARADAKSGEPKPIPGGATAFGFLVHHNPMPTTPIPLTAINDPSEIGDFNGVIIDTQIRGLGTGTGLSAPVSFRADMGAMQGEYIGEDGKHHHGSFVFI